MPRSEWTTVTIGDLVKQGALAVNDGYRVRNSELGPSGVPFVRGGDIGDGSIKTRVIDHIRPEFKDRVVRKLAKPGDVAFITKGTIGRVGWLREGQPEIVFAPQVCYWRALDKSVIDARFLYYSIRHDRFQAQLDAVKTHGSMVADYVSLTDQRTFQLLLPPAKEQRRIGHILGTLDDKIELNRRMNETLEAMARALFKSWFIDFDPVRAKAEGRMPEGMDEPTARLFPDSFQESELGTTPYGWRAESLETHFEALKGLSYKGSGLTDSGMPLHNLNSVFEGGGYKYQGVKFYNGDFKERHKLVPGDVIVTNTEQGFKYLLIGCPAIVPRRFGREGLYSHHIFRVRKLPTSHLTNTMAYFWLRYDSRLRDEVTGYTNGTTVNMLSVDGLKRPLVPVPPKSIVDRFEATVLPLLQLIEANVEDSESLAATRDALLLKLLSGELRIQEAERFVEATL
jgi:type I restriction enzyme S subunit